MKEGSPIQIKETVNLPSGRVFIAHDTEKDAWLEFTEMQDVPCEKHHEVYLSEDPEVIKNSLVPHNEKWLLTVSTQYGCSFKCRFCDVPLVPFKGNIPAERIVEQIDLIFENSPHVEGSDKVKIGFARMGEPVMNWKNVLGVIESLKDYKRDYRKGFRFLPCFNSILPMVKNVEGKDIYGIIEEVMRVKEEVFDGFLHFQISANSTDEEKRRELFGGAKVLPLKEAVRFINQFKVHNRTVTLNFIWGEGWELDGAKMQDMGIDPQKFAIKIIPLNRTSRGEDFGLKTVANYRNPDLLDAKGKELAQYGYNVVTDTIAKCEEAGLCCGQLVHVHMNREKVQETHSPIH